MSRQYTDEEVKENFERAIRDIVRYWSVQPGTKAQIAEGVTHTILALLDGSHGEMPRFAVVPNPNLVDKDYHKRRGENWFPRNRSEFKHDISGQLRFCLKKLHNNEQNS